MTSLRRADVLHNPPCQAIDYVCQLGISDCAETSLVGRLSNRPKTISLIWLLPSTAINNVWQQIKSPFRSMFRSHGYVLSKVRLLVRVRESTLGVSFV